MQTMARSADEPTTYGLEVRCSVQLSYGALQINWSGNGFEPATYGLKAVALAS